MMDGETLYTLWAEANDENDVGVDAWDELDETDHACWNSLATTLCGMGDLGED
jgi:hypothetical protein